MIFFRRLALGTSLCALTMATPALAKAPSNAELAALVKAQAAEIADLKQRLSTVEAHEQQASLAAATTTAPVLAPQQAEQARTNTQLAAAAPASNAASNASDIAALQTQVAQLTAQSNKGVQVDWKEGGPTFRSQDGFFTFHPDGRLVTDVSTTSGSRYRARDISGTEFRDLRLGAEGNIGKLGYHVEVDFAGNVVSVKEAFISYETRLLGLRSKSYLGNSLNDRSIEGNTELVALPFAERNAVASVAAPQIGYFGLGAQEQLSGKGWHVSAAVKGDDNAANDGTHNDDIAYFVRGHVNPVLNSNGFVHLGAWGYHESLEAPVAINKTSAVAGDFNSEVRISASSIANVKSDNGYGAELGGSWHSLWGFAEYGQRDLYVPGVAGSVDQKAWAAYGGWFITGEKLGYSSVSGSFARPKVIHPLMQGGAGAFELLARYDNYNFRDTLRGGDGHAITLGGTWFLNDIFDVKLNLIRWHTNNVVGSFPGKDDGNTLLLRGEIVF